MILSSHLWWVEQCMRQDNSCKFIRLVVKLPKVLCTQSTAKQRVFRVPRGCNFLPSCCQWCPPWSSGFSKSFSIPTAMTKAPTPNQNPGIRLRMFACLLIAGWYLHASNLAQGSFRTLTSFPEEFIASKVENRANFCRNILLGNVFTKLSLAAKPSRVEFARLAQYHGTLAKCGW